MLESIIDLDKQLLLYLNGLGSEMYDPFWKFITKQTNWIPFFLVVFYLVIKKIGWKMFGWVVLITALLILVCDQTTNLVKNSVGRLRPCVDLEIGDEVRKVLIRHSKSFFSGHASNSTASTVFFFLILRRYYKYAFLLFIFPLIFAYSRIYLGLHFPGDIITGYTVGAILGILAYKLFLKVESKQKI